MNWQSSKDIDLHYKFCIEHVNIKNKISPAGKKNYIVTGSIIINLFITGFNGNAMSPDLGSNWPPKPRISALEGGLTLGGLIGCQAFGGIRSPIGSPKFCAGLPRAWKKKCTEINTITKVRWKNRHNFTRVCGERFGGLRFEIPRPWWLKLRT